MDRLTLFVAIAMLACACTQKHGDVSQQSQAEKVTDWVEKMRRASYTAKDTALVKDFFLFVVTRTDTTDREYRHSYDRQLCTALFGDFDGEPGEEMISLVGDDDYMPYLCAFKKTGGTWQKIYMEQISTFYEPPLITMVNVPSKQKTFYLRTVDDRGSEIFLDSWNFYKIINGKVYKSLRLVNQAHVYGWGLFINQEIKMEFKFSTLGDDGLNVSYSYKFFPGAIDKNDCPWCPNTSLSLISGTGGATYVWDEKKHSYSLEQPVNNTDTNELTAPQIACFGAFGNDTLFVKAFRKQINERLHNGSSQQKRVLKKYLNMLAKDNVARTKKLKVTAQAGGNTFYGN